MDKLFFDIETYESPMSKQYKDWKIQKIVKKGLVDPDKIKKDKEDKSGEFALDARTGMVIMVGCIVFNDGKNKYESKYWYNDKGTLSEEKKLLIESMNFFVKELAKGVRLVTFNGKTFDIPFMVKRCIIQKVSPKNINTFADVSRLTRRYYNELHYDVCEILNGGSQAEWAYLLGIEKSPDSKGDQIASLYKAKKHKEIIAKNTLDLEGLVELYKRLMIWWR